MEQEKELEKNQRILLKERILAELDMTRELTDYEVEKQIDSSILNLGKEHYLSLEKKQKLKKEIFHSIRGLDVLQELIEEEEITEIMINGYENIFIEKDGRIFVWNHVFESQKKLEDIIQKIVSSANRIVNESSPIVDARLEDGSRVNIVLPPVAINGPIVTIRKFPKCRITMEMLVQLQSISIETAEFLKKLVEARYNIFISGGTGSGKTTFLNALSLYIPKDERIITIEDSAELQLQDIPNLVRLEVRNANVEGKNEITIRDLLKSALRMRPDRLILGEVRDGAALDLLTAYNTGHDGSLSTGHANSSKDMLSRLETLVLFAADLPLMAVRKQIASAIEIIVHLGRLRDKSRRVLEIAEVIDYDNGEIILNPLFRFKEEGQEADGKIIGILERTEYDFIQCSKLTRAGITI